LLALAATRGVSRSASALYGYHRAPAGLIAADPSPTVSPQGTGEGATVLGIRWTIGDVSDLGFEALRLSILGALRVFGAQAHYAVYVNTIAVSVAQQRCGPLPATVVWRDATAAMPAWLSAHLGEGFAEGVAWKLAPLQAFPDTHELALDNDLILWDLPPAMARWLERDDVCLVAEDVRACFGRFTDLCGPEPRNLGLRGLPPRFPLGSALRAMLARRPGLLSSELDEQGLQLAALGALGKVVAVPLEDVSICSPFPPHLPTLGRCGAHFCGLNARSLGWSLDGYPAEHYLRAHWERLRAEVEARVTGPAAPALEQAS
jgi:hypothetical protein